MTLNPSLKRYAVLCMIVGGAVLALSGLCTGLFMASGPDQYVPNALGVLAIGAIGIVPGAILFFASRHIFKHGPGTVSGIAVLFIGLPLLLFITLGLLRTLQNMLTRSNSGIPLSLIFFMLIGAGLALAITIFGVKSIRAARSKPPETDVF